MVIRMHLNEAPFPPSPVVAEYLEKYSRVLNRYSWEELSNELLEELSQYVGVDRGCVSVYPSSSEALRTILRYVKKQGYKFLMLVPGFHAIYEFANIEGVQVEELSLDLPGFTLPIERLLSVADRRTTVYLSNPNNPTSNLLVRDREVIEELCQRAALVVVDEAYFEFSGVTFAELVESRCSNLVIIRTFSKAFALAGARVGYLASSKELVREIDKHRPYYDVPIPSMAAALGALQDLDYMKKIVDEVKKLREELRRGVEKLGLRVLPSETNFLFIELPVKGEIVAKELKKRGILTKYFRRPEIERFLRVSVALREENKAFLENLRDVLEMIRSRGTAL